MSKKVRIHKLSFKLSRESGWRLALSLAFVLLLVLVITQTFAPNGCSPLQPAEQAAE